MFYRKKTAMPATANTAPNTSTTVSFSFSSKCEGTRIKTGTVAIRVDAIPTEVNLNATIPSETPKKDQKMNPTPMLLKLFYR